MGEFLYHRKVLRSFFLKSILDILNGIPVSMGFVTLCLLFCCSLQLLFPVDPLRYVHFVDFVMRPHYCVWVCVGGV